jgi:8-oxo-dGTP pyrophosphatase MutT (NUDIX family)
MSGSSRVSAAKRVQYAALPYRSSNVRTEVMLVTSREARRWIIPKGWPQKGKAPHRSAAREAFEEAGIVGTVGRRPIGSFAYKKRIKNGRLVAWSYAGDWVTRSIRRRGEPAFR